MNNQIITLSVVASNVIVINKTTKSVNKLRDRIMKLEVGLMLFQMKDLFESMEEDEKEEQNNAEKQ